MAKIDLNDLTTLTNEQSALSAINTNYATIETESDTFLSRDGTSPNQMEADLDMNSNNILNLPFPGGLLEPARAQEISDYATFSSSAPSTSLLEGSLWVDTDDGRLYELRSGAWVFTDITLTTTSGGGGGGSGDVTGPASSTDNAAARFDGTGGKTLQDSAVIISDTADVTGVNSITVGNTGLVVGSSTPFSDASGTLTLQNVDALDATTESTVEAAIDTLANLTSVQGRTVTLADAALDVVFGWDDSGSAYKNFALADITTEASPAAGDFVLIYGAEGDLRKSNWNTLPGAGGGIANVVEDTTPQLGGDLDANTFDILFDDATGIRDDSDNEQLIFQKTASAVNHIEITNAATAGDPSITAAGDDTDIDLIISGKGAGGVIGTFTNTGVHILDSNATHDLIIVPGSNLTADRNLTLTTGDAARTVTISGDTTISQDYSTTGSPTFANPVVTSITTANTGLHILDTNASHDLIIAPGSDLTADHTLTVTTGDADRTLDISAANVTVSAFGATLVDDAAASNARTTLGLAIGTDVQAFDADLTTLSTAFTSASATGAASLALHEDTDNGTNKVSLTAPASIASDKTITFQDVTGTVYVSSGTDVALADGGTGASLVDPDDDRILFWDDSAGSVAFLDNGNGLTITTTTIAVDTASETVDGIVELATDAETQTGTDTARAITPANLTAKEASVANWRSNTADRLLSTDIVWSSMAEVTLTDGANIAWDMSSGFDFVVTLGGNRTLDNPTNTKVGQKGRLRVVQDGTGSRTLSYGTSYEFASATAPTLSTTAADQDVLFYDVISSTRIVITMSAKDIS